MFKEHKTSLYSFVLFAVVSIALLSLNNKYEFSKIKISENFSAPEEKTEQIIEEKKSYAPDYVRALYLTAYSAGDDNYRKNIIEQIKNGRINSVVIDIKDYSGYILYDSQLTEVREIDAVRNRMGDISQVIKEFHDANIYLIARQTVFQDPVLATARPGLALKTYSGNIWYDKSGLAWLDPAKQDIWDYNVAIAKEAMDLGFDEINFDYMRYPSDGSIGSINYNIPEGENKASMMNKFFAYLSDALDGLAPISIDTFGLVLDHTDDDYDLGIGQRLDAIADYFDYVCPMMYPSHYPLNYLGFSNSAEHPGAVISYGLEISSSTMAGKRATLRPWLQAFNLRAVYTADMIDAQIEASEAASTTSGWLLWNARNYYPDYIF